MTDPIRGELVRRKEAANKLALRGVAILATGVPIVVLGGVFAMILPHEFEAAVATVMLILVMLAVVGGGSVIIGGSLGASWADRQLRRLEKLPTARLVQR